MKTIETIANVSPDGKLTVQLPPDVPPGEHKVVLVIDETPLSLIAPNTMEQSSTAKTTGDVWDLLEALAGTIEAPEDWAIEHDHYLYGTPKRYPKATS
jgi:hypothetical protein